MIGLGLEVPLGVHGKSADRLMGQVWWREAEASVPCKITINKTLTSYDEGKESRMISRFLAWATTN